MGTFYAEKVIGISKPRVALLNIGTEPGKGGPIRREAYELMQRASADGRINFIGNIEGRDVPFGKADVVVTDGFSGNVLLKTIEGVGLFYAESLKKIFKSGPLAGLAYLMVKRGVMNFKKMIDYSETGGAPLLGMSKPVVKAHGSSDELAVKNAIRQAMQYVEGNIIQGIRDNMEFMRVGGFDLPEEQ
jgi:glycerol-3-phosphate acyltransferase PlsX